MKKFRRRSMCNGYLHFGKLACSMCDYNMMGSTLYVIIVALIGTAVTVIDVIRIMNGKANNQLCSRSQEHDDVPEVERDLKLMTSILGIEHFTLMMLGAITDYPMMHVPWLLMQFCIMAIELLVFLVRLFLEGLHVTRDEVLLSVLTIHNWLQVFCLFHNQIQLSV
ncbi:PREDICTED: uncharacterized protein LOC105366394 [Ceratosolen solmsi marchali]|uniref:Uncharacterized protein LOC105366394 n=1 Tax=Ceratosolen solmsi marchali TaxID=326594 RepID=A0AAJ7E0G4_9HYME|nr:PREDICTED: uncharacterized protein LOC105366394 [Ceratosolen solmsi marchali]